MAVKEQIDIEALLHRAYAQYRVDKLRPEAVIGMSRRGPASYGSSLQNMALGTYVDQTMAAAKLIGLQMDAASTPDDMLIVHDHVLALSDWLIEGAEGPEPTVWRRPEIAAKGWLVEDTAQGLFLVRPQEGERGGDCWSRLTNPYLTVIVIDSARHGERPDHGGRLVRRRGRPTEEDRKREAEIMFERSMYAAWRAALVLLVAELDGKLAKHAVTGPLASASPWDEADQATVIASVQKKQPDGVKFIGRKTLKDHYKRRFD